MEDPKLVEIHKLNELSEEIGGVIRAYNFTFNCITEEAAPLKRELNRLNELISTLSSLKSYYLEKKDDEKIKVLIDIINEQNTKRTVTNASLEKKSKKIRELSYIIKREKEMKDKVGKEIRRLLILIDSNLKEKLPPSLVTVYRILQGRFKYP